jgi:hypothetical protein
MVPLGCIATAQICEKTDRCPSSSKNFMASKRFLRPAIAPAGSFGSVSWEQRLVENERVRRSEQLVRDPGTQPIGGNRQRLERERLTLRLRRVGRIDDLVAKRNVLRDGADVQVDDRHLRVDTVGDVELALGSGYGEARRKAPDIDGRDDLSERAVDDRHRAVILDRDVQPAGIRRVPNARTRVRADPEGAAHIARLGIDERHRRPGAIHGRDPRAVGAHRDGTDVLSESNLLDDAASVDVDEADRAGVAIRGPDSASQRVEDHRRRRGIGAPSGRDDGGRLRLKRNPAVDVCASVSRAGWGRRRSAGDPSKNKRKPQRLNGAGRFAKLLVRQCAHPFGANHRRKPTRRTNGQRQGRPS